MPTVTFTLPDGQVRTAQGKDGQTLLQVALDATIPMEHACGGNGFCTTCLCNVTTGAEHLSPRNDREENMGITDGSQRLGCQAQVLGDCAVTMTGV
jgi:adenylate cyclase